MPKILNTKRKKQAALGWVAISVGSIILGLTAQELLVDSLPENPWITIGIAILLIIYGASKQRVAPWWES